jgi:transposase
METIFQRCAGLDVHKESIMVCVRCMDANGKTSEQLRRFGTMTRDLLELSDWLAFQGVTHVAMESTGVYWKPVFNVLEMADFELLVVNAQHLKKVPGRKTDVVDAQWIAHCLQVGLLRGSFVPKEPQRELRDLTRHRTQLVGEVTRVANRLQKILEDANVKLSSVASDTLGASGRDMLRAIVAGENDPKVLAELARGRLRAKLPALRLALEGHVTEHHRFMLGMLLDHLDQLEEQIECFSARIEEKLFPFREELALLDEIPGVDRTTSENLLAELGTNMNQFPTDGHACSWAGVCPGNRESAGKRKSGKMPKGNRWLRTSLVQAAWAATRAKGTYLSAQYKRLVGHRGKKRALMAVAHTILQAAYHMLKDHKHFHELGADYFERLQPERLTRYLVKRLQGLGFQVNLTKVA